MKRVFAIITLLFISIAASCASNQNNSNENVHNATVSNASSQTAVTNTPKPTDIPSYTISYFENGNTVNTNEPEALTKDG